MERKIKTIEKLCEMLKIELIEVKLLDEIYELFLTDETFSPMKYRNMSEEMKENKKYIDSKLAEGNDLWVTEGIKFMEVATKMMNTERGYHDALLVAQEYKVNNDEEKKIKTEVIDAILESTIVMNKLPINVNEMMIIFNIKNIPYENNYQVDQEITKILSTITYLYNNVNIHLCSREICREKFLRREDMLSKANVKIFMVGLDPPYNPCISMLYKVFVEIIIPYINEIIEKDIEFIKKK
jgi:hypothetical protein